MGGDGANRPPAPITSRRGRSTTPSNCTGGRPGAARAVGNAARANPWPLLVPCHRLVASQGLGGYGGDTHGRGLAIKRWLLAHEGYLAERG